MIPRFDVTTSVGVPGRAAFWIPDLDEVGDTGIADFHDTWTIAGTDPDEAHQLLWRDAAALPILDQLTQTEDDFERLAGAIEFGHDFDELDEEELDALDALLWEEGSFGLDFGVAGLVLALGSVGIFPAASCRSHASHSWSPVPVVVFAIDRAHAELLAPLVTEAACGLAVPSRNPELLCIEGPSLLNMIELGFRVLAAMGPSGLPQ